MQPIFYKKYVTNIIAIFEYVSDGDEFYGYLNNRYENLKFTFSKRKYNKFFFLDILINNSESDFQTSIFHKKKYTGFVLN